MSSPSASPARTVVVTGASAGLGVAMARAFGELGWRVAIGARRMDRLSATAALTREAGGEVLAHVLDVADPESVEAFFAAVEARFGPAEVVVNNAGLDRPGRIQELDPEEIRYEMAVNLLGPIYTSRRAVPAMLRAARPADLIFVTSDAARNARPQQSVYTASKAGLEGFSRALSMELEGTPIRCTIVRPGPAASEYAAAWDPAKIAELLPYWQRYGLQRHVGFMPPEAVARAVVVAATTPTGVVLDTIEVQPMAPLD